MGPIARKSCRPKTLERACARLGAGAVECSWHRSLGPALRTAAPGVARAIVARK